MSGRRIRLYDEARTPIAAGDTTVTALDLTLLALAPVLLVLLAYPLLSDRSTGQAGAAVVADRADASPRTPATTDLPDRAAPPARDLAEALRISGGSLDIADSLLEQMLAELPAQTEAVTAAIAGRDWPAARSLANAIEGGTAVCATPALHGTVRRLQVATRDEDLGTAAKVLSDIDRERRRLLVLERPAPAATPLASAGRRS